MPTDSDTRRAAIVALGRIGDRRAVEPLIALLERARPTCRSPPPPRLRASATRARSSRCWLCWVTRTSPCDRRRRGAQFHRASGHGVAHLHDAGRAGSTGPRIGREDRGLLRIRGMRRMASFARCADDDEAVRAAAIEHLPYFDDARALQMFASVLDKDTPRVRAAAAKALGALPGAPSPLASAEGSWRFRCLGPIFRGEQHGPPRRRERARHPEPARHDRSGAPRPHRRHRSDWPHRRRRAPSRFCRRSSRTKPRSAWRRYAHRQHPLRARRARHCAKRCARETPLDGPQRSTQLRRAAGQKRLSCFSGPHRRTRTATSSQAALNGLGTIANATRRRAQVRSPRWSHSCPIPRGAAKRSRSPAASRPPRFLSSRNRSPPTIRRYAAASSRRSDGCRIPSHRRICSGRCRTRTKPCAARQCEPCPVWEHAA